MEKTQTNGSGRACHHVLSAASTVVIDVLACGVDVRNVAGKVVDQIAAKVPQG
jgi:hypothetical protein